MYHYAAKIVRVIDADTIVLDVDLGFKVTKRDTFRLKYINAPELSTPAGVEARAFLERLLDGKAIEVETTKDKEDKYGRMLATVWASEVGKSQLNVNLAMVDSGHAVKY
jgi:micrococcal nuclease